jgi:hypothetical protein
MTIPLVATDLDRLVSRAENQSRELSRLFRDVGEEHALRSPGEGRWSMTGHVAHLVTVNEAYLRTIDTAVERTRKTGGPMGEGPYRHPMLAKWFVRELEPPPKRRIKTFKSMIPNPATGLAEALEGFDSYSGRLRDLLELSRGIDLGRVRFSSPFSRLMRLSLGTAFAVLLAHDARHIWLIEEVNRGLPAG